MKNTGKPYEGELHVRFDEKAEENMKSNPPLYSTSIKFLKDARLVILTDFRT
ncbi:MAG: hypothetical protein E7E64_10585 [Clostridium celatum]|nr:hypothetical protein [Clostridium celatum]MDU4978305.1 hypothetical protein [Clostridium celatum]